MARKTSTKRKPQRRSIGFKLILRQLRADSSVFVWLLVVAFVASLFLAATPRLFNEMSDDGLRQQVRDASPIQRNVSVARRSRIAAGGDDDSFAGVRRSGERFLESDMPESLRPLIIGDNFVVESPRFEASPFPGESEWPFSAFMRVRYQQDVGNHVLLVAGTLPEPQPAVPVVLEEDAEPELLPLYQVAVTGETLTAMGMALDDRLLLAPDRTDRAYRGVPTSRLDYHLVLEFSGIIEPTDPGEPYWHGDFQLHRPQLVANPDFVIMYPTALMAAADYRRMLADSGGAQWEYSWRYLVDPERLDAGSAGQVTSDFLNLELGGDSLDQAGVGEDVVTTGLPRLIGRFLDQRRSTVGMLSLVSIGLFAVSAGVIALLAALVTNRQSDSLFLLRSRGASRRQLAMSRLSVGLLLSVPAAALGLVVAILVIPGRASTLSAWAAIAVCLASSALVVLMTWPVIGKDLGAVRRGEYAEPPSLRRRVVESVVVAVAIVSIVLLRRRGLNAAGTSDDSAFDPLLAAAPALLAVAVGIVTLRMYVYPVRLLARLGARRRDVVTFVGFRRILQQPVAVRASLIVILLAVAVAVFAGTVRLSIDQGQQVSTWQEVGADYRITGVAATAQLSPRLDVSAIDSIEASAFGLRLDALAGGSRLDSVEFLGLEALEYNEVTAGTEAAANLPGAITRRQAGAEVGTERNPIPAVVSRRWAEQRSLAKGHTFVLDFGRSEATFVIAEHRDRFPGLPLDRPFVVANVGSIEAAGDSALRPTVLYLRAPESAFDEIDAAVRPATGAVLTGRGERYDEVHEAPLVAGVGRGFSLAFWVAAAFAVVAVVAAFALTLKSRLRDLAFLRTLGLTHRDARRVATLEHLPPTLIVAAIGSALGAGMAVLFKPGIDLAAFTGPGLEPGVKVDLAGIAIIVVGLALTVLLAVRISGYSARDDSLGGILRLGDE